MKATAAAGFLLTALQKDGDHEYGLKEDVPYGVIHTKHFSAFDYEDDVLLVTKVSKWRSSWLIKSFEPGQGLFDGTSLLPDKGTRSLEAIFKAALFHDVVYKRSDAISKATGIPQDKILAFADDMLALLAEGYGAKKTMTRPIHWLVRVGGSIYHKVKKLLPILLLTFCPGCFSLDTEMESPNPPEVQFTGPFFKKDIQNDNQGQNHQGASEAPSASAQGQSPQG